MRKLLSLFLALIMLLALMPAATAEPYTIDIYWVGNEDVPEIRAEVEAAINDYIGPKIDAKVSFHIIPWGDWESQVVDVLTDKTKRLETKMDLVFTADWEYYGELVEAKALYPLQDFLDEYGQDILENIDEAFWEGVKINGVIYGVPTNKELCVPQGFIVNKTAAEAIGWDYEGEGKVTSTADLEPWLQKYREMFPEKYPYLMDMSPAGRWTDEPWINDWSGLHQNALAMKMAANEDGSFDETVYSIFETPEEEEYIRLMYKYVQAGYISPENASWDKAAAEAVFGRGDFLVFTQPLKGNGIKAVEMYTSCHKEGDAFEVGEIIMQPKYVVTAHTAGSMFAIPAADSNPDKAMQYLNLMHSDATLVNLMLFGVEGKHYTKLDDKKVELTDSDWYSRHAGAWTVGDVRLQYVLENEDPDKNDLLIKFAEDATQTCCLGFRFNKKLKALRDTVKAVDEVLVQYADGLVTGSVDPDDPEKGLEAFKTALKDAGMDTLREAAQQQYEEWKSGQW